MITGIQVGDKIIAVNGNHVWTMTINKLRKVLDYGEAGEALRITVKRKRSAAGTGLLSSPSYEKSIFNPSLVSPSTSTPTHDGFRVIELTRNYIPTTAVFWKALDDGRTGYIKITEFTDRTALDVDRALQALRTIAMERTPLPETQRTTRPILSLSRWRQNIVDRISFGSKSVSEPCGLRALVIDLRGNPGGALVSALDVASMFLRNRKPLLHMNMMGRKQTYFSENRRPDERTALLLLTDQRTASASEILVAALRDHGRAVSMGATTVGKSVAQVSTASTIRE